MYFLMFSDSGIYRSQPLSSVQVMHQQYAHLVHLTLNGSQTAARKQSQEALFGLKNSFPILCRSLAYMHFLHCFAASHFTLQGVSPITCRLLPPTIPFDSYYLHSLRITLAEFSSCFAHAPCNLRNIYYYYYECWPSVITTGGEGIIAALILYPDVINPPSEICLRSQLHPPSEGKRLWLD